MTRRPLAVWRALRVYLEGARATVELAAELSGYAPRTIALRAEREGWRLDRVPEEDLADKLRVVTAMLVERVEALGRKALEEGTRIDKAEIEGLLSMIKGLDRLGDITRTEETAINKQIRRDEDLGDVLQNINERIIALATELAGQMAAEARRQPGG
jgi:hypothetical protein